MSIALANSMNRQSWKDALVKQLETYYSVVFIAN